MAERIEPREGHVVAQDGVRLHYLDWGIEGNPPLVLLHGFSSHAHYWDGFSVRMRNERHVFALDQRGHGDSDWAEDYAPDAMPKDVRTFADALGLERFALLGHSMGAMNAIRFAAKHPERLEALVLVDAGLPVVRLPGPRDNSVTRALAKDAFANEDEMLEYYSRLAGGRDLRPVKAALMHNFRVLDDGRLVYKYDPKLRNRLFAADPPEAIAAQQRDVEAVRAALPHVTCPVLVIRGALSDILTPAWAAETASAFPNGKLVEIPNTTHMVPTDDPAAFRTVVRAFLGLPA